MDANRMTRFPSSGFELWIARWTATWKEWTPRVVLWTLAGLIGLWFGTATRPAAARTHTGKPATASQASLADVFRWDILLVGQESSVKPARTVTPKSRQFSLPEAFLVAQQQRPEPVPSPVPKTLSCTRPRFAFAPPPKPSMAWQMKWDGHMAGMKQMRHNLHAALATVPGLTAADRDAIQVEVDQACAQVGALRNLPAAPLPDPPEPPVLPAAAWPEPHAARLLP